MGRLPRRLTRAGARLVLVALLLLAVPLGSHAQEVPPPDTLPPLPTPDTLPAIGAGDSIPAARPRAPEWRQPRSEGFDLAVWDFDAEALARFQGLSLFDLLELLPGIELVRAGGFGRPTGMHAFGAGGGRVRVFRDGVELDPLESATLDLQRIGVAELESLRVERGTSGIRLDLATMRLRDQRPFSQIEAATGDFQTRFLRGVFARPIGSRDVILLHFEVTDTDGFGWTQPFSLNALGARWTRALTDGLAAELHFRRTAYERGDGVEVGAGMDELQLRLRGRAVGSLLWEAYYAAATREGAGADPFPEPLHSRQLGLRASLGSALGRAEAALRTRPRLHGFHRPGTELDLRTEFTPHARLRGLGDLRVADGLFEGEIRASAALPGGFAIFGGLTAGRRAVGLVGDTTFPVVRVVEGDTVVADTILPVFPWEEAPLRGSRVGAGWSGRGWSLHGAALGLAPGLAVPFGLAFDRGLPAEEVQGAVGMEGRAVVPLPVRGAWLQGDWVGWSDTGGRPHLPRDAWRLALHFHRLFYEGNLEPTLRIEAVRRGAARVPLPGGGDAVSRPTVFYNAYLQIRVLDVRAFVHWENVFHDRRGADLPGFPLPGQRAIYGVRWQFFD